MSWGPETSSLLQERFLWDLVQHILSPGYTSSEWCRFEWHRTARKRIAQVGKKKTDLAGKTEHSCSFCGKRQDAVRLLIEKPGLFICNACVADFNKKVAAGEISEQSGPEHECSFCSFMRIHPFLQALARPGNLVIRGPRHSICNECLCPSDLTRGSNRLAVVVSDKDNQESIAWSRSRAQRSGSRVRSSLVFMLLMRAKTSVR